MKGVKQLVFDAIADSGKYAEGDSFKMRHPYRPNGEECTPTHKDPCLTVTRGNKGWVFYCHRCQTSGSIRDTKRSVKETVEATYRARNGHTLPMQESRDTLVLPYDYMFMREVHDGRGWDWLHMYNIDEGLANKYHIGWSEYYQRVILPCYNEKGVLDAWVGRDVSCVTKEERRDKGVHKYLTRSQVGERRYFTTDGDPSSIVILVEDILSAILVHEATDHQTVALLQCSLGDNLIPKLAGKDVFIWLDPDVKTKSIQMVNRLNQMGAKAKMISSQFDPKEYGPVRIRDIVLERMIYGKP